MTVRNSDGTFRKGAPSPNPAGRGKGKKSEVTYNKLKSDYDKQGKLALDRIMEIADKLFEAGQLSSALKAYVFVADKKYQLTIHDHKLYIEEVKAGKKDDADIDDEDEQDSSLAPVIFAPFAQKEA